MPLTALPICDEVITRLGGEGQTGSGYYRPDLAAQLNTVLREIAVEAAVTEDAAHRRLFQRKFVGTVTAGTGDDFDVVSLAAITYRDVSIPVATSAPDRIILQPPFAEVRVNSVDVPEELLYLPDEQRLREAPTDEGFAYYTVSESDRLMYLRAADHLTTGAIVTITAGHVPVLADFPPHLKMLICDKLAAKFAK